MEMFKKMEKEKNTCDKYCDCMQHTKLSRGRVNMQRQENGMNGESNSSTNIDNILERIQRAHHVYIFFNAITRTQWLDFRHIHIQHTGCLNIQCFFRKSQNGFSTERALFFVTHIFYERCYSRMRFLPMALKICIWCRFPAPRISLESPCMLRTPC